jgi:hypothetical protein
VGKDILPIHSSLDALRNQDCSPLSLLSSLLLAIPMLTYVTGWGIKRRADRRANDQGFVRSSKAMNTFNKAQKKGSSHLQDQTSEEFYRLISRAFKEYMGDKINVVGSALTPQEAEERLRERGIDQQLSREARVLLEDLEKAQFSAVSHPLQKREELLDKARLCAKTLERQL